MRKREQYQKPKFQNKIPTLIIMCVCLALILIFGKKFSWSVAGFFAPQVAVTDEAVVAVQDGPDAAVNEQKNDDPKIENPVPTKAGSVISQANQSAARKLLPILTPSR